MNNKVKVIKRPRQTKPPKQVRFEFEYLNPLTGFDNTTNAAPLDDRSLSILYGSASEDGNLEKYVKEE